MWRSLWRASWIKLKAFSKQGRWISRPQLVQKSKMLGQATGMVPMANIIHINWTQLISIQVTLDQLKIVIKRSPKATTRHPQLHSIQRRQRQDQQPQEAKTSKSLCKSSTNHLRHRAIHRQHCLISPNLPLMNAVLTPTSLQSSESLKSSPDSSKPPPVPSISPSKPHSNSAHRIKSTNALPTAPLKNKNRARPSKVATIYIKSPNK